MFYNKHNGTAHVVQYFFWVHIMYTEVALPLIYSQHGAMVGLIILISGQCRFLVYGMKRYVLYIPYGTPTLSKVLYNIVSRYI